MLLSRKVFQAVRERGLLRGVRRRLNRCRLLLLLLMMMICKRASSRRILREGHVLLFALSFVRVSEVLSICVEWYTITREQRADVQTEEIRKGTEDEMNKY
jgi:hypothetical protein|tara:strand:- start:77 stop:379 length:303 start_codon:yes stop_codon:yes gene_type:complete